MAEDQKVGFVTMGEAASEGEIPSIGIGMLGYAFMGKAHSNALKKIAYMTWPPPFMPRLVEISGRNEEAVKEAARRYGYESGRPTGATWSRTRTSRYSTTAARTTSTSSRPLRPRRPGSTSSARSRSGELRTRASRSGKASPARRQGDDRLQLPLLSGDLPRQGDDRRGRAGRDHHFRGRYHQEWIMDPQFPKVWRLDERSRARVRSATLGAQ